MNTASGQALSRGQGFPFIYPSTSQKVAIGATSAKATNPVGTRTSVVRLVATVACHVKFGDNTVTAAADGSCTYLAANVEYNFGIAPGDYIAVIEDSTTGNLFITEGA